MEKKERIICFDLLRVVAIFAMMMLHVAASQFDSVPVESTEWFWFNFYDSIVRFCVPVLVMISGIFFLDPERDYTMEKLLKKNVWRLVTAYFFWAFCYAFVDAFLEYKAFHMEFVQSLVKNTFTGRYHLWFVYMMIGLYLLVPILRKIAENEKLIKYFIVLSFLFCYVGNMISTFPVIGETAGIVLGKMSITMVGGYVGYFFAGYYFYHFELSKKQKNVIYGLGIVSVIATIVGTLVLSRQAGMADRTLYNYLFPTTCLSSWAVFLFFKDQISKIHFSEHVGKGIVKLSELSFGMYLVHDFVNVGCKKIGFTTVAFPAVVSVPVIACVVFGVSFLITWVMSKIPFAKRYLM